MAAITYWCVVRHVPVLQQQITGSAQAAVASANAGDIDVSVVGRTATLSGVVSSDIQKAQLISVVEDADGVRTVNDQLSVLKTSDADESVIIYKDVIAQTNTTDTDSQDTNNIDASSDADADAEELAEPAESDIAEPADEVVEPEPVDTDVESVKPLVESIAASDNEADEKARVFEEPKQELLTQEPAAEEEVPTVDKNSADEQSDLQVAELVIEPEQPVTQEPSQVANMLDDRARALIEQARRETAGSLVDPETPRPDNGITEAPTPTMLSEAQRTVAATTLPTLSMQLKDGNLTLTGDISNQDSLLVFIRSAMSTFDANYVVNSVQVHDQYAKADWLPALNRFLPDMSNIKNAGIDIIESQITLSGEAPDKAAHDGLIDIALVELSELSLVERISISAEEPTQNESISEPAVAELSLNTEKPVEPVDTQSQTQSLKAAFESLDTDNILFESGSDVLTEESRDVVNTIAALFSEYPSISVEIDGHTDASGISANNLKLSQLRANAVRDYLVQQGVAPERLSAYGFGDGVPIADNSTPAGRRLNRRIEFNF